MAGTGAGAALRFFGEGGRWRWRCMGEGWRALALCWRWVELNRDRKTREPAEDTCSIGIADDNEGRV